MSSALVVGNFLSWSDGIPRNEALFFNDTAGLREGVWPLLGDPSAVDPLNYRFSHPLNAEIHDLKILINLRTSTRLKITEETEGQTQMIT